MTSHLIVFTSISLRAVAMQVGHYLGLGRTSQGKGMVLTSDTRCRLRGPGSHIYDHWAWIGGFTLPLHLQQFTSVTYRTRGGTVGVIRGLLVQKGCKSEPAKRRDTLGVGSGGSRMRSYRVLSPQSQDVTSLPYGRAPNTPRVLLPQPRRSASVLSGFHPVGVTSGILAMSGTQSVALPFPGGRLVWS